MTSKNLFTALFNILLITGVIFSSGNFTRAVNQSQCTRTELQFAQVAKKKTSDYYFNFTLPADEYRKPFLERLFNIRLTHFKHVVVVKYNHVREILSGFVQELQFYNNGFHAKVIEYHCTNFCG